MKRKKVLFVISSLTLGGGAENVLKSVVNNLDNDKYNIKVLTFYDKKKEYKLNDNISRMSLKEKINSSFLNKILKLFNRVYNIRKICKNEKIETVVGFMEESNFPIILMNFFLIRKNIRILITIHASPQINFSKIYKLMARFLYKFSDKIICVSKDIENYFLSQGFKNLTTIYNSIDLKNIEKVKYEELTAYEKNIFKKNKILINIGRLELEKNHEYLIDIFSKIKFSGNKKLKLIILGEGSLRKKLEIKIKKLKLEEDVFLLGNKSNVFKYLNLSDLFVFTSRFEGFGNVLIEAMGVGLPVISNDCLSGPNEILTGKIIHPKKVEFSKYGVLIPFNNKNLYIEAISKLLKNKKLLNSYKEKSLKRSKDFEIKKIIKEWEKII